MSEFEPGDKAKAYAETVTILAGPENGVGGVPLYWVRGKSGNPYTEYARVIKPIPPADPRVDVVARAIARFYDNESIVDESPDAAHAVLVALDAMPKDEKPSPRLVRDRDGDVWEESDGGTWIGVTFPADVFGSYRELAERYGPLTDV